MTRLLPLLVLLSACAAVPVPKHASYHAADAELSITRVVHDSVIVELAGTRVIVDPWFHSGLLMRQSEPLGLTPDALPPLQAVLLTHEHADHFNEQSLRMLAATVPEVIAPAPLRARLAKLGFKTISTLGWWDALHLGAVEVTAVPARHSVPENGYVLEAGGVSVYVAGDTRYFPELVDVATRFPHLEVALLPIGGERLFGFLRQMGPGDAARAAEVLAPRRIIPIGYGERSLVPLWWYTWSPTARFAEECAKRGIEKSRLVILDPGESWHYYR